MIYCRKCGEPWEKFEIDAVAEMYHTTSAELILQFKAKGCHAFGSPCNGDGITSLRGISRDFADEAERLIQCSH